MLNIGSAGTTDVGVRVWSPSLTLIDSDSDSGSAENFLVNVNLPVGTHYIEVFGENGAIGDYFLGIATGPFDDHGDTLITATPVSVPGSMPGNLEVSGDEGCISFSTYQQRGRWI